MRLAQNGQEFFTAHQVAAGRQGAERGAVVGLEAGDGAAALGLADLKEVLAGEFDRGLVPLRPRRAEPRPCQTAGFVLKKNFGEVFGRLVGEGAGMGVRHCCRLPADGRRDPAVAVSECRDGRSARGVDDFVPVGGVEVDAVPANRDGGDGAGAVEDAGHGRVSAGWERPV